MTTAQIIATKLTGTIAENMGALVGLLAQLEVKEYETVKCPCGAELLISNGRHTGYVFVRHPLLNPGLRVCPRSGYRAWAPTVEKAAQTYMENAPSLADPADFVFEP